MMVVIKIVNSKKQQSQPTIIRTNHTSVYFKMFESQLAGPPGKAKITTQKY